MPIQTRDHEVKAEEAGRVDKLVATLVSMSRGQVRGLIAAGGVQLNGRACADPGEPVAAGDRLTVRFDPSRRYHEPPPPRATHGFTVVYQDEHLVVVNKEAGLLTVPTDRGDRNTLVDRLNAHLKRGQVRGPTVGVVHRLDRDTSGLLVFARRPEIATRLIRQFAEHHPDRQYVALAAGRIVRDRDTIRSYLSTDRALNQRSGPEGDLAVTHYEVQRRYRDVTAVAVRLETGQRNQIRVHLAELGHPVLGDVRYRPDLASHPAWPYPRLALHARSLGFAHPVHGRPLVFEAELPREFQQAEDVLRRDRG